ncbi:MAG TPA: hypothetical protein VJA94_01745, partial [Candidatus Angelobacter sp.]
APSATANRAMPERDICPVTIFDNLSCFAGVSEVQAEQESAGEILSAAEGSAVRVAAPAPTQSRTPYHACPCARPTRAQRSSATFVRVLALATTRPGWPWSVPWNQRQFTSWLPQEQPKNSAPG